MPPKHLEWLKIGRTIGAGQQGGSRKAELHHGKKEKISSEVAPPPVRGPRGAEETDGSALSPLAAPPQDLL